MPVNPDDRARAAPAREVYSVTRVNREVRALLERGLGVLWVEGELSNLSQPASGHWYFSLKDRDAQLRCAMFRMQNSLVGFTPRAGTQVLVRGRISVYEARGEYQLIVEHLEEAGIGALKREFERLKAKLAAEGLFAPERKRSLPRFPQRIGVITSPSGAALRDILHVLARRFPPAAVLVYPAAVQGAAAAPALVAALESASARAECQVLILARGGGSLEDLWAFNDERLAHGITALVRRSPDQLVREYRVRHQGAGARLQHAAGECLSRAQHRLALAQRALNAVSPLATLTLGIAIVTRATGGTLLTDAAAVAAGEEIEARLARGSLRARVTARRQEG